MMDAKKNLKRSTRYHDVYIENDVPAHQLKLKNNLLTIVNTRPRKMKLHEPRVIKADENTDVYQEKQERRSVDREREGTTHIITIMIHTIPDDQAPRVNTVLVTMKFEMNIIIILIVGVIIETKIIITKGMAIYIRSVVGFGTLTVF